jgi:hypothetical protein
LVPGPPAEVETVRWIYRTFVTGKKSEAEIARLLNLQGVRTDLGRDWTRGSVHRLLTNEKYVGNNVWNKHSFKLKKKHVTNSPEMWVRATSVFQAIVNTEDFLAARKIIEDRDAELSDAKMLQILQHVLDVNGYLSGVIIDETEDAPSSHSYARRFGGLRRAYKLIGYASGRDERHYEINRALRLLHPEMLAKIVDGIHGYGGAARVIADTGEILINEEVCASLVIARCRLKESGSMRWIIRFDRRAKPDLTIAVRMDSNNTVVRDYYLLPSLDRMDQKLRIAESNGFWLESYRVDDLTCLFELAARNNIAELAA